MQSASVADRPLTGISTKHETDCLRLDELAFRQPLIPAMVTPSYMLSLSLSLSTNSHHVLLLPLLSDHNTELHGETGHNLVCQGLLSCFGFGSRLSRDT